MHADGPWVQRGGDSGLPHNRQPARKAHSHIDKRIRALQRALPRAYRRYKHVFYLFGICIGRACGRGYAYGAAYRKRCGNASVRQAFEPHSAQWGAKLLHAGAAALPHAARGQAYCAQRCGQDAFCAGPCGGGGRAGGAAALRIIKYKHRRAVYTCGGGGLP